MGLKSKQIASPRVIPSLVLCAALLVCVLIVPGSSSALERPRAAALERVEIDVWSPSSWMAWLVERLTGDVLVTQEAASAEVCIDPECSPPDAEPTGGDDTGGGGGTTPDGEGTPGLDVNG